MPFQPEESHPPSRDAERIYVEALAALREGESLDLAALCGAHPDHAEALRVLHEGWQRVCRERPGGTLAERLAQRYGREADPGVFLQGQAEHTDAPSAILERLAGGRPAHARYELEGEVARGGMGAILRVWDEDLRRHLAMKVVLGKGEHRATGRTPEVPVSTVARFLEEAQVTGQLDHPGIVPVHELGIDGVGRVYFTMKLVKGVTLEAVFDDIASGAGGWTQARALGLVLRICEAMAYAHDKGVIHRDLKPANVMVGKFGEVYVMDWGLAKVLGRDDRKDVRVRPQDRGSAGEVGGDRADSPLCTMDGDVVGTPAYMSPEQAAGRLSEMGPASDVYALGAILYHLLAGHMPYAPKRALLDNYALWRAVQAGPPERLQTAAPEAPAELVAICEKAMSREPSARYATMSELAEDLAAFLEGRVVRAFETGAWAEARKWIRRNKALAASLAAAVALLIAGLGASLTQKARADAKAREAYDNLVLAHRNEAEAEDQRAAAEREREHARAETAKVLRLADVKVLQELEAEADSLWPAHPHRIASLEAWLRRARELAANLPGHRATIAEMRNRARPLAVARSGSSRDFDFGSPEEAWQYDVLAELIEDLGELEHGLLSEDGYAGEHGWSVPKRLAFARELERGFAAGGGYHRAWQQALPAIRGAYPELAVEPQMGLVPLGPDPESGRWEFADLMTGVPPGRGADGKLVLGEESGVVLVLLHGGKFWMGAQDGDPTGPNFDPEAVSNESPVHEVELSAFFLSKYELTQAQWLRITGRNPSHYQSDKFAPTLLHPVEQVTWLDCAEWLPRAGLALPSEAQWEYGARAGTDTAWWTGAERESLRTRRAANLADQAARREGAVWQDIEDWPELDDGYAAHAPVGTYTANGFGLHEVAGNVWEWCQDGYETDFYARSPVADPVAHAEGSGDRVCRGGNFNYAATLARSARRSRVAPSMTVFVLGVRPARALAP